MMSNYLDSCLWLVYLVALQKRLMIASGPDSFFFFFGLRCAACGISVPQLGIESVPPAVEAWSPNHWTAREFLPDSFYFKFFFGCVGYSSLRADSL